MKKFDTIGQQNKNLSKISNKPKSKVSTGFVFNLAPSNNKKKKLSKTLTKELIDVTKMSQISPISQQMSMIPKSMTPEPKSNRKSFNNTNTEKSIEMSNLGNAGPKLDNLMGKKNFNPVSTPKNENLLASRKGATPKNGARGVNLFKQTVRKQIAEKQEKKDNIFGAFTNMIANLTTNQDGEENSNKKSN